MFDVCCEWMYLCSVKLYVYIVTLRHINLFVVVAVFFIILICFFHSRRCLLLYQIIYIIHMYVHMYNRLQAIMMNVMRISTKLLYLYIYIIRTSYVFFLFLVSRHNFVCFYCFSHNCRHI